MPAPHALFPAPAVEEPHGHQAGGWRALFAFPPFPTWQEQVKGDAGRGPAAGRASRSSFSTSHLTPARPSAHVLTAAFAPHDPLAGAARQPLHVRRSPRRLSISMDRATLRTAARSKRGPSCAERGLARGSERGSQDGAPWAGRPSVGACRSIFHHKFACLACSHSCKIIMVDIPSNWKRITIRYERRGSISVKRVTSQNRYI